MLRPANRLREQTRLLALIHSVVPFSHYNRLEDIRFRFQFLGAQLDLGLQTTQKLILLRLLAMADSDAAKPPNHHARVVVWPEHVIVYVKVHNSYRKMKQHDEDNDGDAERKIAQGIQQN